MNPFEKLFSKSGEEKEQETKKPLVDPESLVVMTPEELAEKRANEDRNNP
ncbi:MAG: hypothetical protein UY97_C0001G0018 [Parcubacteria group bacterium GW2011_GWB1_57_6]|nr:MAG: hypothetical protein UY93_C0001G0057 [Parcubacteria group bacterium GW2011_GWA1_56_13]KKW46961.1 MAG: hypothetical protein UY97_C0001G0018 [Parcubacteria group bacterium GW2011_GWB1_57_6]